MGNKGKSQVREPVQRTHRYGQWVGDCLWEQGLDGSGKSNEGKSGDNCK